MALRDIVNEIRKIRERTRDPRGHDFFLYVEPFSFADDVLREFGGYHRAQLAVARDWLAWHEEVLAADEARLADDGETDPYVRHALAESVTKHESLIERWQVEEKRLVDLIDRLEEKYFSH